VCFEVSIKEKRGEGARVRERERGRRKKNGDSCCRSKRTKEPSKKRKSKNSLSHRMLALTVHLSPPAAPPRSLLRMPPIAIEGRGAERERELLGREEEEELAFDGIGDALASAEIGRLVFVAEAFWWMLLAARCSGTANAPLMRV